MVVKLADVIFALSIKRLVRGTRALLVYKSARRYYFYIFLDFEISILIFAPIAYQIMIFFRNSCGFYGNNLGSSDLNISSYKS